MLFYLISQKIQQGYYKQLYLWFESIKHLTKTSDLQLETCEKLVHFSKNLE